jgi:hypothetical protein
MMNIITSTLPLEGGGQGGGESVERFTCKQSHALIFESPRPTLSPHPLTPAPSRGGGILRGLAHE